jgi:hypothetical protein
MRVCAVLGCPELFPKSEGNKCREHRREHERARGTRQQRGYDASHDRLRAEWAPKVKTGRVACARCQKRIQPGERWHLDHTDDRTGYLGPSHERCNTSAGGRAAHN